MVFYLTVTITYQINNEVKVETKVFVGKTISMAVKRFKDYVALLKHDDGTEIECDVIDIDRDE